MVTTLMNTKGAAAYLGCTENWIHKLVYAERIKAHIYNEQGVLVEREAKDHRQGQGLYFYEADLKKYQANGKRGAGRPAGTKNTSPRVSTTAKNSSKNP